MVDDAGGSDSGIMLGINKARGALNMIKNVWILRAISPNAKLRIFNSNVKTVLLYGAEIWRGTKLALRKIETFINQCLRRILGIRCHDKVRNEDLWKRADQEPMKM